MYLFRSDLNVPCICLSYPCHKSFMFPAMLPANEIMPAFALRFDFRAPLHSVHQAQQDLFISSAFAAYFARQARRRRRGIVWRGGRRHGGRQRAGRQRAVCRRGVLRRLLRRATKGQVPGRHHSTDILLAARRQQGMQLVL